MQWLWLILLLGGVAVAVPALDRATNHAPEQAETAAATAYASEVRIRADELGHFRLRAVVGGRDIAMLADTGASYVALTSEDARRVGIEPSSLDFSVPVKTANGTAEMAQATLPRIEVEGIVVRDVPALVAKPQALQESLLGMTFLKRLREFSVRDGMLVLAD